MNQPVNPIENTLSDRTRFASCLLQTIQQNNAIPTLEHGYQVRHKIYLQTCTFIFFLVDDIRKPLKWPYKKHYRVIEWITRHFIIDKRDKRETQSIDRIKCAFFDDQQTKENTILNKQSQPFIAAKPEKNEKLSVNHTCLTCSNGRIRKV